MKLEIKMVRISRQKSYTKKSIKFQIAKKNKILKLIQFSKTKWKKSPIMKRWKLKKMKN